MDYENTPLRKLNSLCFNKTNNVVGKYIKAPITIDAANVVRLKAEKLL